MNLGLDLRGGAHLLAEVHVEDVYADRMDGYWLEVRTALVGIRDQVGFVERDEDAPKTTSSPRPDWRPLGSCWAASLTTSTTC